MTPMQDLGLKSRSMAQTSDQPEPRPVATRCPRCGQHFSPDAGFCPFDAEALVSASDWGPSHDPLLGSVVDQRYEIEALIGEGGMGSVYRVRHVRLGRAFAMKALRRDLGGDAEIRERFVREARTAASVSHPGLVRITDFGSLPDGRPFFVMELLEGLSLRAVIQRGPLPPARAARIACRLAEAMAVAHEAGVVHRDLKPDNVHLTSGDGVKVVDFGLAVALGGSQRVTRSGIAFGTPHYMSPEQAMGEPVDRRTDVYALGVVLYEMLAGHVPFDAATSAEVLGHQQFTMPAPLTPLLGTHHELQRLEQVVLVCLAKRAEDRFPSLNEVSAALGAAMPSARPDTDAELVAGLRPDTDSERARPDNGPAPPDRPWSLLRWFAAAPVWALGLGGGLLTAAFGLGLARWLSAPAAAPSSRRDAATVSTASHALPPQRESRASVPVAASAISATPSLVRPDPENQLGVAVPSGSGAGPAVRAPAPPGKSAKAARTAASVAPRRSPLPDEIVDPWSR